ncbi:glycosyltransferase [Desulfatibacillum aliphaticivorans]|uniref:glycosyltransferase n=1 Tax=Desulfatibacillum aliphaticivorans TaxID=218208 RepID=UPI0003FC21C7|nr:glycosyltransferase [Desulfatibacillum aliphaticivorans]
MKNNTPKISIIVVNYNGLKFLEDCFTSLTQTDWPKEALEVICVDNGSTDGSQEYLKKNFPDVAVLDHQPNNYAAANNAGIKRASGDYVILLNNDVKMDPGWLRPLAAAMELNPRLGGVQPKLLYFDGMIQSLGHIKSPDFYWTDRGMGEPDLGQYGDALMEADSLCGACAMYRRECLDQAGRLDEDFNMFVEDVDFGVRCLDHGWPLACQPQSRVHHLFHGSIAGESRARLLIESNRLLLIAKHWPDKLAENLTGRGFFLQPDPEKQRAFIPAASKACGKLLTEHPPEKARRILDDVFIKLAQALDPQKDALVRKAMLHQKEAARELEVQKERARLDLRDVESRLYAEIDRLRDLVIQREEELRLLRESLSYRYVLKPVQKAADRVKGALPRTQNAPPPSPALPRIVSMKFTNNCQLKCRMCGIWSQEKEAELPGEQWRKAIDKVFHWLGPYRLDIAGGEPLLRPDNDELTAYASAMGVETVLLSNGALITKARARKLLDSGLDSIHVSLDSLTPEVHDRMRGKAGTFAKATKALKHLQELRRYRSKDFSIGVASIVMAPNVEELPALAEFVYQGGADFISFQALDQNFHDKYDPQWFASNPYWIKDLDALNRSMDKLRAMKLRGAPIDNSLAQLQAMKRYFADPQDFCRRFQCLSGEKNFIIKNNGDVLLCWNLPPVGNILHDAPERIWQSSEAKKRREQIAACTRTCRILSCHVTEEALQNA